MLEYDYDRMYDAFLGINTREPDWEEEGTPEDYNRYEVTPYAALSVACEQLSIKPTDCVVDFGCGKGRILFFFNNFFQCRVKGIEHDAELFGICDDNRCYYDVRFHGRGELVEVYNMKGEEYEIHPKDNYFYFFNPCSPELFERILEHIVLSIDAVPRVVSILLYYPTNDYLRIMREMGWTQKRLIRLPNYKEDPDEKLYLFRNPL